MEPRRHIVFVVFDGIKMLDVAGPAEVFAEANLFGAHYSLSYASPSGEPVITSVGLRLPVDKAAADVTEADTVVVSGATPWSPEPSLPI
ncbi:DJ-1/PfpI family protein [Streptomyces sp. Ncost-T10-10d]|nr:DJ-1/PfpI family protein [Streptomyces sp. Ncost-T10-10d]